MSTSVSQSTMLLMFASRLDNPSKPRQNNSINNKKKEKLLTTKVSIILKRERIGYERRVEQITRAQPRQMMESRPSLRMQIQKTMLKMVNGFVKMTSMRMTAYRTRTYH